jgi:hypothetical protein
VLWGRHPELVSVLVLTALACDLPVLFDQVGLPGAKIQQEQLTRVETISNYRSLNLLQARATVAGLFRTLATTFIHGRTAQSAFFCSHHANSFPLLAPHNLLAAHKILAGGLRWTALAAPFSPTHTLNATVVTQRTLLNLPPLTFYLLSQINLASHRHASCSLLAANEVLQSVTQPLQLTPSVQLAAHYFPH